MAELHRDACLECNSADDYSRAEGLGWAQISSDNNKLIDHVMELHARHGIDVTAEANSQHGAS